MDHLRQHLERLDDQKDCPEKLHDRAEVGPESAALPQKHPVGNRRHLVVVQGDLQGAVLVGELVLQAFRPVSLLG